MWKRWPQYPNSKTARLNLPEITEQLEPERTTLTLTFEKKEKIGDKKSAINIKMKETIIEYLTDHAEDKASSIADYIGLKPSCTKRLSERTDYGRRCCRRGREPKQDIQAESMREAN